MKSLNGKFIVEPYKGSGKLKAKISGGFATVEQKTNLVGLKLLVDAIIPSGSMSHFYEKGSIVYFSEETLHIGDWSKQTYTLDSIGEKFILAPYSQAIMIDENT